MPKLNYFLGADPGEKGAVAVINSLGRPVFVQKMPANAYKLLEMLRSIKVKPTMSAIERIDPRPTGYMDKKSGKWVSSILRSTCIIYGDFLQLHMAMIACDMDPLVIGPKDWQSSLEITKKAKWESNPDFKRRLKTEAEGIFPGTKVTLINCDALLLAEYCRRRRERENYA